MKTAKLGAIFLVSVLALAGTGMGYAMWSETLYIDGWIQTGYIDAEWSIFEVDDSEPDNKDFSYVIAEIEGDTLYIDIYNAYPCIDYWVVFDVHNTGSIPIHLYWDGIITPADFPGTITMTDLTCIQLHPYDYEYGTITIHLNNDALENSYYSFETTLVYHQWNEVYP